jgi:DNA polymerase III epsilon subunit-like protein
MGAVKLDENLEMISSFNRLVQPEVYPEVSPFISEMTGIVNEHLTDAKPFSEVYAEFTDFIKGERIILCVWGMADIKELFRNANYHNLDISSIPREYINLQSYASKYFSLPAGVNVGLSTSVELLNIPLESTFHNAYNDAYYTAEIFKKIYSEKIKIKIYELDKPKKPNNQQTVKSKIDTYKLIKQFEKMFNRELSADEKKIIKLAYMMGKTNQFQIEVSNNTNVKK